MLKGIPGLLSPELVKTLMEMGHGDEVVLADGNFPSVTCGQRLVRADGLMIPDLLRAVLKLFPLDPYDRHPVCLMGVVQGDAAPDIWTTYREIVGPHLPAECAIGEVSRFDFYERAKRAFAVVATGETALYGNIILKKGCVTGDA